MAELGLLTSEIVSAFVSKNRVAPNDLGALISATYAALAGTSVPVVEPGEDLRKTPSEIRRSITSDALISFIDGKKYRMLKRHIRTNNMTPAQYFEKFGLDNSYPLTAPGYSAARSALAKSIGLGKKISATAAPAAPEPAPKAPAAPRKAKAAPDTAGVGATVPKAKRTPKERPPGAIDPTEETFS